MVKNNIVFIDENGKETRAFVADKINTVISIPINKDGDIEQSVNMNKDYYIVVVDGKVKQIAPETIVKSEGIASSYDDVLLNTMRAFLVAQAKNKDIPYYKVLQEFNKDRKIKLSITKNKISLNE